MTAQTTSPSTEPRKGRGTALTGMQDDDASTTVHRRRRQTERGGRAGRVLPFLVLTFALTWGFQLLVVRTIGHSAYLGLGLSPLDMLFPAAVAFLLQLLSTKAPQARRDLFSGASRWIMVAFLVLTALYGLVTVLALRFRQHREIAAAAGHLLMTSWTLVAILSLQRGDREALAPAGIQLGDAGRGMRLALGVAAFIMLQAGRNLLFGLGQPPRRAGQIYGVSVPPGLYPPALVVACLLALTGTPLSGLAAAFGEEYGWRGFLQEQLTHWGQRRGVLLVGLVWGLWHAPVIFSGVHTYPPTIVGFALGMLFFLLWGFFQSYAVVKTGSVWVAAFLHALVDSLYGYTSSYVISTRGTLLSFGLGVYGLICLTLVVLVLSRDPVWRDAGGRGERTHRPRPPHVHGSARS